MIRVSPEIREKLNSLKESQKESYTDVLERILKTAIDTLPLSSVESEMVQLSLNEVEKGDIIRFSPENGNNTEGFLDTLVSKTVFQHISALPDKRREALNHGLLLQKPDPGFFLKKIPDSPYSSLRIEEMRILLVLKHNTTIILSLADYREKRKEKTNQIIARDGFEPSVFGL